MQRNTTARISDPCTIVIFGATGDLTRRKLVPALYNLRREGLLHANTTILGFARRDWSDEYFRTLLFDEGSKHSRASLEGGDWPDFISRVSYIRSTFEDAEGYTALAERLDAIDAEQGTSGNRLFYLATPPESYEDIINNLGAAGLANSPNGGWTRIIVEKPFGHDLESALHLNKVVHDVFEERQVYRIDHYLGKETVQNLLVLRFANGIFEPLWNRRYIDHVQITVAESIGVEGRGGYYEQAGAIRDMVQNHMMQLLSLTAMEPPVGGASADAVRDEKVKVLRAVRPIAPADVNKISVRGRYSAGPGTAPAYLDETGVQANSTTETYVAMRFEIESWRWAGVPFYLRTGKRMPVRASEITVVFKSAPLLLFQDGPMSRSAPNELSIRIQPNEGIALRFNSKVPGQAGDIRPVTMNFNYVDAFGGESPEAYERLLLDAMTGDTTLFTRSDEVETSWSLINPIIEGWKTLGSPIHEYVGGSWGPDASHEFIGASGRSWRRLS
ncbi:MAG: glucose-6-phosphate dehydrogenase [Roseiflexaceae bacterium]|jgi:glucose-6-phosphate 1-dehydrogenase